MVRCLATRLVPGSQWDYGSLLTMLPAVISWVLSTVEQAFINSVTPPLGRSPFELRLGRSLEVSPHSSSWSHIHLAGTLTGKSWHTGFLLPTSQHMRSGYAWAWAWASCPSPWASTHPGARHPSLFATLVALLWEWQWDQWGQAHSISHPLALPCGSAPKSLCCSRP